MRVLAGLLATLLLGTCSDTPPVLEQIQLQGELRVATRNSPTAYWQGVNGPDGPEYALAERFARALGVRLKLTVLNTPDKLAAEVKSNRAHLAAAGLAISPRPEKQLVWGPPYMEARQYVIVRPQGPRPGRIGGLRALRVEVVAGSAQAAALRKAVGAPLQGDPPPRWKETTDVYVLDLLDRVSTGKIDATVANEHEYRLARNFHPELTIAFELREKARLAWWLPRYEPELIARVESFFKALAPELPQWLAPHYADPERLDYVGARNFIRHVNDRLPLYRVLFQQAGTATGLDWRLIAAIGYQESKWDPAAVSKTGVRGMMMLQENTASRMGVNDRGDAQQSILGGARYFLEVRLMIPARIPEPDRSWLALAAYNIGFGHLEDARVLAQQHGRNADRWQHVRTELPLLTTESTFLNTKYGYARGYETVRFVDNVRAYLDILEWVAPDPEALAEASPETDASGAIRRSERSAGRQKTR
jgi:membrane-bound lytic murein transglycosylase F